MPNKQQLCEFLAAFTAPVKLTYRLLPVDSHDMNVFAAVLLIVLIQGNFFQLKVHLKQLVIREHTKQLK